MYRRDIANDKENLYTAGTSDKNGDCLRTLDQSSNAAQGRERAGSEEPELELVLSYRQVEAGVWPSSGIPAQSSEGPNAHEATYVELKVEFGSGFEIHLHLFLVWCFFFFIKHFSSGADILAKYEKIKKVSL